MAALSGYWDDSDGEGAIAVAGYVGPKDLWPSFESAWNEALGDLPYLHMKELNQEKGPFKNWDKSDPAVQKRTADLLAALTKVIGSSNSMRGFGASVPVSGVHKFNHEKGLNISAKAVALFGAAMELQEAFKGEDVNIVLDRTNDAHASLAEAEIYFNALVGDDPDAIFPTITPLSKNGNQSAKNIPPLQAADFYAWELRKSYVNKIGFYETESPPNADDPGVSNQLMWWFIKNRMEHVKAHGLKSVTIPWEPDRRSFIALDVATANFAHIWDYRALNILFDHGAFSKGRLVGHSARRTL